MNNISVTPKGGTIASELSGNQVNLTAPSLVKLHLNQSDIKSFTRNGNDLVVTTKSGEVLVIHNFYSPNGDSDLVLQDDRGAMWWVEDPGTEGFHYVSIDSTEGLLAENTTNDGTIAAFGIGGAALAGIGALIAGGGGGGGGGNGAPGDNDGGNPTDPTNPTNPTNPGGGDTTAPAAISDLVINDAVGPYQGAISAGAITDDNTPTLSGTAEAGAIVSVYDGNTLLGTVTVGTDGTWSFTTPALADGQHSLTATVTDAAGNTSTATTPLTFTVDTVAPDAVGGLSVINNTGSTAVPITNGGATKDTTPALSGTAEAGSIITIRDGNTVLGSVTVGSNGAWSFTSPTLSQGSHTLSITATDAAGNSSTPTTITFTVDTQAPAAAIGLALSDNAGSTSGNIPNGSNTDDNTPILSGNGEVGAIISVYDGQLLLGTAVVGSNGAWSFTPSALSNGSHSFTVTQTDAAGNVSPSSEAFSVTVQAAIPPATTSFGVTDDSGNTLVQLSNGASTHDNTPTLSGLATAGALITLYNGTTVLGSVVAGNNGQWSFTPTALADGSYALHASVTDSVGNVTQTPIITITVDTVAPAAAAGVTLSDNDGGTLQPIAAGGATHNTTPVLSGTAEPGSTVTVRDGATVLGTVTVGSNGGWSFTSPVLSEGGHSLTTTVTDAAGNVGPASSPIAFTVDTQPPAGASNVVISDNVGASTGPITAGTTTDDSTPTLTGNAEANAIVNIYDGTTLLGSVIVGSNGSWSFTTPTLSNGSHSLSVTVTDAAGNVSPATTAVGFTVNAGVPPTTSTLEITDDSGSTLKVLPEGASTNDVTPILSGLASAGAVIQLYNGTTLLGSTVAGSDGQWSFTPATALADGTYAFHATATDTNGNVTDSGTINITIDNVAPAAAGDLQLSDNNGSTVVPIAAGSTTNDSTPILSGTAEAGSTVTVLDGTTVLGTATVGSDGSWSFTSPTLSDGNHSLTTTVTDPAGNTGPASAPITLTVDTLPPAVVGNLLIEDNVGASQRPLNSGDTTDDRAPTLSGTGEPNATISIYDGTTLLGNTTVGTDGTWSFTTPALSNGNHTLTVTATDTAGNVGPASPPIIITVEAAIPPATASLEVTDENGNTVAQLTDGASTNNDSPVLSGLAGAGSIITLYDGTTALGSTTAGSNGQWIFYVTGLTNGPHALHGTITDTNGNVTETATININVDTIAPDAASGVELTNDAGSITQPVTSGSASNDATPVLSGSAEAGSTVTILDGTTVLGTVAVGSDGNWHFTTPILADGNHSLTTTVSDAAGNVSPATSPIAFSVDTTAPSAVSGLIVTDNVGSSTGALTSDAITDDNTPTLTGTAEAGSVVRVYDGSTLLGSVAVGNNGSWSFTPDAAMTNGQHSLTTTVTDAAGNVSPSSPVFTLNVDAGVPATSSLLIVTDDGGSTLVELPNNSSTHDTTPILSGQAGAGDLITLYNGTTVIGSTVAGSDGQWNFTPAALADATYAFHATATNATSGAITDSPTINITIDTTVPTAPTGVGLEDGAGVPIPEGSSTNNNTPTLTGSGEVGSTVTISDGTTVLGTTTVDGDGNWSYTTPPLSDGDHSLTSTVTDPAGNTGPASASVTVTVDTQAPAAAGNVQFSNDDGTPIAAGGSTSDTTPTLGGTAEPGSTVTVSDGTTVLGTAATGTDGNWSFTPTTPLSEGQHNLTTTVTDPAGNVGPASSVVIVIVDTLAPAAATDLQLSNDSSGTLVPVAAGGTTNDVTPVLSGRAEPGSIVTVSDGNSDLGSVIVGNDGNWSFTSPTLDPGTYSLTTTVTDPAGNVGAASAPITFTIDTTAPPAPGGVQLSNDSSGTPLPISSGAATNDATPVMSGTAAAGSTVTVSDGGTVLGTVTVGSGGTWSFTTPALNEGNHSLTATVTSPAGNTSAPSTPIVVTVDTTPPAAATGLQLSNNEGASPVPIAAGGTTNDTTPALSGTAEAGSIVTVSDGNTVLGSVTVGSNGSWTFTPATPLSAGEHTLSTTVTDAAGNIAPTSPSITVNIDTAQPPVAGSVVLNNDNGSTPVPITSGGATNDTTPVISGTAAAGSTVTVLDGTTVLGTVTVDNGGSWSFTTPGLSEGAHSLSTTVTSPSGNVSEPSAPIDFSVDTQAPAASTALQLSNDGGAAIATGGITNDSTPVLSGTAEAGSTVTVRDGTTVLGTATAGTDGSWRFTPATALGEGAHSLTTTVTDPAGNSSGASTPITFTVDTTPPAAATDLQLSNDNSGTAVPIDNGGRTNDTTPVLSGSAEAGSVVTVRDGTTVLGSTTVGTDGKWSFTPTTPLDTGLHSLTTTVTDAAGNVGSASPAITLTVDTTAPPAASAVVLNNDEGSTPTPIASGGATNDTTPVLSGTAEADSIIIVRDGTTVLGSAIVGTDGTWSFTTPTLSQGSHSLTATVTDAAGNSSAPSTTITFTVDTQAPSAATALQLSNDSGQTAVPIAAGGATNDTTPVLSGSAEAGTTVIISDGSNVLGSVVVGSGGTWSFTSPVLGEGAHSLTTTVTDPAGNVSAPSAALNFTIDTTPPPAPDAILLSNNNGSSPVAIDGNSITNDATPLLNGTAEAGSTVTVFDGTTVLGTTIVGSNGQWSFTTPTLGEGAHSLTATVTDLAGNSGPASRAIAFTVDTVAPAAATDLALNNDNGGTPLPIANNGTTNDSTPLLSGTAEANSIVIVSDGTTVLGSAITNAQGDWRFSPTLTDGSHNLSVTVRDEAGNTSGASSTITVTVDTVAPPAASGLTLTNDIGTPVNIPNGGLTNDNTPVLSGAGQAGSIITVSDQNGVLGSVTVGAGGTWSFTPTAALADGTHTLSVTARDAAGNVSAPSTIGVVIDATPPAVAANVVASNDEGTSPVAITNGGFTNDNTPFLTGTAEAGSTVIIRDGTTVLGSASVGSNGQWSFTSPTLDDGSHSLTTTVADAAGNVSPASPAITFTVDASAPAAATLVVNNDDGGTPVLVPNGSTTNDNTPLLSGNAEAGSLVTLYDGNVVIGSTTAIAGGTWSFSSPALTDGPHTLTATVTDEVGNVSAPSSSFTIQVDATAPQPADNLLLQNNNGGTPVTIADGGITNDSTPAISGTAEANAIVRVYDGTTLVGSAIAGSNGAWSITTSTLANATHTLNVTVTDAAGNVSSDASVALTVDTSTPAAVLTFGVYNDANTTPVEVVNEGDTNDNTPVISGTGVAGTTINVYEGPNLLGTTTVGDNGVWRFETNTLSDGQHSFTVSVTNAAGTTGPEATPITVYIDTAVPDPILVADLVVNDNVGGSTGPLTSGQTTDDNTPTFTGAAEAGSKISIYDGTTLLASVTATGGNWSYTPGTALSNGEHNFTFTVTDAAGNVSTVSSPAFTLNIAADLPPTSSTLVITDDNGSTPIELNNGANSNDSTPVLTGAATEGDVITIHDGAAVLGSVTVGAGGQWNFTPTLTDGAHGIFITTVDAQGNPGATSDTVTFNIDTVAPVAVTDLIAINNNSGSVPIANNGTTNDSTPLVNGTTEANGIVTLYDGNTVIGSTIANGSGEWSFTSPTLSQGGHVLSVTVTDAAGNVGPRSSTVSFTVDTVAPNASTLVVTNDVTNTPVPNGGATNDNTPTLSGTAEVGSVISVYDGTTLLGSVAAGTGGAWNFTTAALGEGSHPLSVRVTDAAGNISVASSTATVVIDTLAPTAVTGLAAANNNGSTPVPIAAGGNTNDNTPALSGTAEAGSIVNVYDGTTILGSVTAGSNGAWSFTSPTLSDGAHTLNVTATDAAGNISPNAAISLTVTTTAPAPVTNLLVADNVGAAQGNLANGASTDDNTPTLSGTATAGNIVIISEGSTVLGSVVAGSNGSWSFTTAALSDGSHPLSVTVRDAAGNTSTATNFTVNVDTVAPANATLLITNDITSTTVPNGGSTNDSTPTLSGTADAGSRVSIYDGTTLLGTATAGSNGAWSFTPEVLTQGAHPLSVTVTDAAGNVSGSTSATVTIDTVAPVAVTGLAAANNNGSTPLAITAGGSTNDNTPALSGTAEAGSLVIIRDGTTVLGSVTAGSNGAWTFTTPTLAEGAHTFNITATDAAGNVSPNAALSLTVDTVAPAAVTDLAINDDVGASQGPLLNGAVTDDATPTLSGTAEANAIVTIYDGTTVLGSVAAGTGGAWSFTTATLSNGTHPLSVTVKDAAGNTSAATTPVSITVDTVAPGASTLVITNDITSTPVPGGGSINDSTPTLSGVAEAGSRVSIYDGTTLLGTATAGSNGAWSFTTDVLTTGTHPLSVTVTDAAGNVSGSTSASVIIDTTPPAAVTNLVAANNNGSTAVTIPNNGVTNDNTPLLMGAGEIGAKISVYDSGTLLGTATVGSNGTWSFISTALSNGSHTLNVTATDAAGNVSPTTSTTLTIDTVAPNPVTNLVINDDVGTLQGPLVNGAVTDDATPTLSGTAEANAIVTILDGTTVLGSVAAGVNGVWSFTTATLSNGTHPLSVTVTDAAGNTSAASATVSITVDTVAPTASTLIITNDITSTPVPGGGSTNDTTPTLSGVAEAGSRVSIFDGTTLLGTAMAGSNGTWTFTTAVLTQGTHPLSVTVTDTAGNVSGTTSASVVIDTVAPVAVTNLVAANNNGSTAVTIPTNGITNDSTPLLTGSGEIGARISVYDGTTLLGTTTVGSNGTWSFITTALSNGPHTLNVTATDAAGNVSPNASTTLTIDTVAPTASTLTITDDAGSTPITLTNGAYTRDTTPVLSGTAEVGAIVTLYDGTIALGSVTVGAGGTWTYTTTALANGAHPLSVTVTDAAGNVSTGNTAVTVNIDTVPPAPVTSLAINDAGTSVTGSGEVGATVTVRDAGGNALGTATVGTGGTWTVNLSTAQTTGASLSVIQTDRAGNVSTSTSLTGAIRIVAANDVNEVDYTTQTGTINNGNTSSTSAALLSVNLGSVLGVGVLTSTNAYMFNVGTGDTRAVTLHASATSLVALTSTYTLYLYQQQADGSWALKSSNANYISTFLTIGTQTGSNVTYSNLGTGNYAVLLGTSNGVGVLPSTTVSTTSDITTLAVTVAATVTGNLLTNDTSSVAGTVPTGTAVTQVTGHAIAATGNTVITSNYGTLTIDSHGNYTYVLKAGVDADRVPATDVFTYSVRDASGAVTSASLTVNLHNGAATSTLLATNSQAAEATSDHDASGSIYGSSTGTHSGTLSIANEHGDITTVHSVGNTSVAGDFGVLSIAANGSYTYSLNADVDGQSITHKEVFNYTLAASDGTITTQSFTIELHPTITGTTGADTLTGGAYNDTITSGAGADTLVYHLLASADATGGNGHDTWTDFNVAQGDKIDVSNLLIGWNDSTSNINDFVKVDHTSEGNTVLSIDRDGTGTGYSATQLITLEGVNVSLEELLQQPHQNHTA
jgi:VCBS repeat-containing protein